MSGPYRKPAERPAVPRDLRRWYTKAGDVEKGPFDTETLIHSARDGYIKKTTLVRAEDDREWLALSEVVTLTPVVVRVPRKQTRHSEKRIIHPVGDVSRDAMGPILGGLFFFGVGAATSGMSSHIFIGLMVAGLFMMGRGVSRWMEGRE